MSFIFVEKQPEARMTQWTDTTASEIKLLMALIIYMDVSSQPTLDSYWSSGPFETPFVKKIMSFDRHFLLDHCLHFVNKSVPRPDTTTNPKKHPLWKIKPFFDSIVSNFKEVYIPTENVVILQKNRGANDENIYELRESGSGYVCNLIPSYAHVVQIDLVPASDGVASSRIALTLVTYLLDLGYQVFMDEFYSSPALFAVLRARLTDAVGSVMAGRLGMPRLGSNFQPNSTRARFTADVMALKWVDEEQWVTMISTVHDDRMVRVTKRGVTKKIPQVINDYNRNTRTVDKNHKMITSQLKEIPNRKGWYTKFFCNLIIQAAHNSYILHRKLSSSKRPLTYVQFAEKLIRRIVEVSFLCTLKTIKH